MEGKTLCVHHVGFGTRDLDKAREFYMETLEFTQMLDEWDEHVNTMADAYRNSPSCTAGIMPHQEAGGLVIEPLRLKYPTPRAIREDPRYGDIGVNKLTIAVADVNAFVREYQDKVNFFAEPQSTEIPGLGPYDFIYAKDPEGNVLEFAAWEGAKVENGTFGGAQMLGISVTDLERSKAFYQTHCGFDVVVGEHEAYSGKVSGISGSPKTEVKSCILDCSGREHGMGGMLELYEVSQPRGRSIPFGTEFGDFGYLEACLLYGDNIIDLYKYYVDQGLSVWQRPTCFGAVESMNAEAWFVYIRDPDGILVESVALHSPS